MESVWGIPLKINRFQTCEISKCDSCKIINTYTSRNCHELPICHGSKGSKGINIKMTLYQVKTFLNKQMREGQSQGTYITHGKTENILILSSAFWMPLNPLSSQLRTIKQGRRHCCWHSVEILSCASRTAWALTLSYKMSSLHEQTIGFSFTGWSRGSSPNSKPLSRRCLKTSLNLMKETTTAHTFLS